MLRHDLRQFEPVQQARCLADAAAGVAGVENRCAQGFARRQRPGEIERVETAGDPYLMQHALLHGDAPGAAPGQRAEPHVTVILGPVAAALDREPRVVLVAGGTAPALQHGVAGRDRAGLQLPFAGPAAGEVAQRIILASRQVPTGRGHAVNRHHLLGVVLDQRRAADDAGGRVDHIMQRHVQRLADVAQAHVQRIALDPVRHVVQHQVAIAIGVAQLQVRLHVHGAAPAGVFLQAGAGRRIERDIALVGMRRGQCVTRRQPRAPVQRLQLIVLVDAERVGHRIGIDAEYLRGGVVADGLRLHHGSHAHQHARQQQPSRRAPRSRKGGWIHGCSPFGSPRKMPRPPVAKYTRPNTRGSPVT